MWIVAFIVFGSIIYPIVYCIVDIFSDKVKQINRKKYYGEEELTYLTTYNNNNISNKDIMNMFILQINKYKQHYFYIDYKVFKAKEKQNYAWDIRTTKKTYGWGIIYYIKFHFSNGWIYISFSNEKFYYGNERAYEYNLFGYDFGSDHIERILVNCKEESRIIWKINGKNSTGSLPFDYISLTNKTSTTQNSDSSYKQYENSTNSDLINFYRTLLGLKTQFTQEELKKCYREAVRKYHPDRYGASSNQDRENAEMLMKQINEAYEALKEIAV